MENNIVSLPFTRLAAGIDKWGVMSIERPTLAVCVSFVLIGIKHLDLIAPHEINPTIAPSLSLPFHDGWRSPLDVQLAIAEFFLRENAALRSGLHHPAFQFPLRFGSSLPPEF